jgi:hypothetical protein
MKKIRNIRQLNREQEKLLHRQLQLEKEMREAWRKIKKSARPQQVAKDLVSEWMAKKWVGRGIVRLLQFF